VESPHICLRGGEETDWQLTLQKLSQLCRKTIYTVETDVCPVLEGEM
jgi:hypothetical protein